jgi:hypothetical protein
MSDETAGRRLSPYYPPSDRAKIYTVLSAYLEVGLDPDRGADALFEAAHGRPSAESLAELLTRLHGEKGHLGERLLRAFKQVSPVEQALLAALSSLTGRDAAAMLLHAAAAASATPSH